MHSGPIALITRWARELALPPGGRCDIAAGAAGSSLLVLIAGLSIFAATALLDLSQLASLIVASLAYILLQEMERRGTPQDAPRRLTAKVPPGGGHNKIGAGYRTPGFKPAARPVSPSQAGRSSPARPERLQESKMPVFAPRFTSERFDEQVDELIEQIKPSPESEQVARQLAACAQQAIQEVFPEVEVSGFASADVVKGTAFGVAVPELDLVARADPAALMQRLQSRLTKGGLSMARLDARKLQKSAIRACTDQLVSVGGFKFRRSAFRGQEPKVTLMAPPALGVSDTSIPVDFSVNCVTPLYNTALVAECNSIDARARSLILLVRRWAKDRGVCHAAKGHLQPYAWTLLAMYFLQVGLGIPLLPPLQGFKMVHGMAVRRGGVGGDLDPRRGQQRWESPPVDSPEARMSVAALFGAFVRFYWQEMDWQKEAVSVRCGLRRPPNLHLMLSVVLADDGSTEVGPSIEDPFEPARNLGSGASAAGMVRLREELERAHALMEREDPSASLAELLQPWSPPERANAEDAEPRD